MRQLLFLRRYMFNIQKILIMQKLKKYSLKDLKRSFECMNELEKAMLIGGGYRYSFDAQGHMTGCEYIAGSHSFVYAGHNSFEVAGDIIISSTPANNDFKDGGLSIKGGDINLFKFLAQNTGVEWAASYNPGNDAVINTCFTEDAVETNRISGYSRHIHSHPIECDTQEIASSHDISAAVYSMKGTEHGTYNYSNFEVYMPQKDQTEDYTNEVKNSMPKKY